MTLKLWGRISSINVRKPVLALQMLGVPFERVDAGQAYGIVDTPEYATLNPNAKIPTLQDGELTLWESNVIVRYLSAKFGYGRLYPADLAQRALAEQWMDWQQTTMNPASRGAFWQWIRTPLAERDEAVIVASLAAMKPLLKLMDAHLAAHAFMAGPEITMADIPVACELHRWTGLPHPEKPLHDLPHLSRWWAAVCAMPAAAGVLDLPLS